MTVRNEGSRTMIECNGCGQETHDVDKDDFQSLVDDIKADGWKISSNHGRWTHHCPDCEADESALAKARRKFGLR